MYRFLRLSAWSFLATSITIFIPIHTRAQNSRLTLQPGSTLTVAGGNLVVNNTDLLTNGAFNASTGTVVVTGSNNSSLGGLGVPIIQALTLNTTSISTLSLSGNIQVSSAVNFQNGLLNLNGNQLQLTGSGVLQSESETSHLTGPLGGSVTASAAAVSNPDQLNIGNLGAELTTTVNLGAVTITRSQVAATNPGNSSLHGIERTYLIQPQNDAALNATLRLYYLNEELNGDDPSQLNLWTSADGVNWSAVGADSYDVTNKYAEKTGIAQLSYWTLSDIADPLPLTLVSFKAICEGNDAIIQWQTAMESGLEGFVIQRSADATAWADLGEVAASNNPSGSSYTYTDTQPQATDYYRLKIVAQSGTLSYSPVFSGGCADIALPFLVYPNPTHGQTVARISVREATTATLELYGISGQLILQREWNLQPGNNQYVLSLGSLASGTYLVKVSLNGSTQQALLTKD